MLKSISRATLVTVVLLTANAASAQESVPDDPPTWTEGGAQISLLAGLIQPILLRGGNLELDIHWRRLVVGYSHGFLLKLSGSTVVGEASEQHLAFNLPYSTGVSVGVRVLPWLDIRGELKAHRFEVGYDGTNGNGSELFSYTTWTLGVGVYARWRPFESFNNWASGFVMTGSVRFWPNIGTSVGGPATTIEYDNQITGMREEHKVANIGIANTPLIVNFAIGWAFDVP